MAIDVNYKTKKASYTVTSMDGTKTYLSENDIAYYDTNCSKVTGLEIMNRSNGTTMYIDNIKLYAVTPTDEQPEEYNVTLNANGGTINSGNITKYTFGEGAALPTDVTRSGYTFSGWYDNADCTGTAVTAISATDTGDKEYWAKWTPQAVEPKPDTPAWPTYQKTARVMEKLDRGLTAVKMPDGVYLSWRLLGSESLDNQAFDIYRSTDGGAAYAHIATSEADGATCYTDTSGAASYLYKVVPSGAGQTALDAEKAATPWTTGSKCDKYGISNSYGYKDIVFSDKPADGEFGGTYMVTDMSAGDLDGDGEYELVVRWDPDNAKDNSQGGNTDNVYLDAYKMNGQKLWRMDLGPNIRAGTHYTQFIVYDFDNDGKQEIFMVHEAGKGNGGLSVEYAADIKRYDKNSETGGYDVMKQAAKGDIGRGVIANVDDDYAASTGNLSAFWSVAGDGLYNMNGDKIGNIPNSNDNLFWNFFIWWDGDLGREMLDKNMIAKQDIDTNSTYRFYFNNQSGIPDIAPNYASKLSAGLVADLFGDWREEAVYALGDGSGIRIFFSTIPTEYRLTTLMHDSQYRLAIAWQNVAYNKHPPAKPGVFQ